MIVQRTSNAWGREVRQGSFCPVQLISPKIIPPVEGGGGARWLLNNVLYGGVPPLGLNPYSFIVEGARRVCLGLEPSRINFSVTQFFAPSI